MLMAHPQMPSQPAYAHVISALTAVLVIAGVRCGMPLVALMLLIMYCVCALLMFCIHKCQQLHDLWASGGQ